MSLLSMTGFGRGSADAGERRLRVEIRSVNHRGLDLKIRSSEPDATCDAEIGRAVRGALERGSVIVQIRDEAADPAGGLDERRVRTLYAVLERLREELRIEQPVSLGTVGAFMETATGGTLSGEALWEVLRPAVTGALSELQAMRAREGEALAADLRGRRERLVELAASLRAGAARLPQKFAERLADRLAALSRDVAVDPGRLAQEVALMAERLDVTEELVRLDTHLDHLGALLGGSAGRGVGRKLDFLLQEIGRELNTIGSKAQDAGMAALVIDAKAELERLREQAQNVE
ncbi:MAG TPA: YicC/YloC family endoribonuclease [Polyangia bacterium]|nr:YicC/YloC family endoribonuclease [Polyangia bacterium]